MESKVKSTVTGLNPNTGEVHHLDFEGDAVCLVVVNDEDESVQSTESIVGTMNLDRAMAMVKSLASACKHLLNELPPIVSHIIMNEMMNEILNKVRDDEQEALKEYDARRAAENGMA